jgi:GNAT superfamily N-acetyltransferase
MIILKPLSRKHLQDVIQLVMQRYSQLLQFAPILPQRYMEIDYIRPLVESILDNAPGVIAFEDGIPAGFMGGWLIPDFRGRRAVFSPEWGNAANIPPSERLYAQMYAYLGREWLREDCYTHLVGQYADRPSDLTAWQWLGFGMLAADGARNLESTGATPSEYTIKLAGPGDTQAVYELCVRLSKYLAKSPTFLFPEETIDEDEIRNDIVDPQQQIWLSLKDGKPVSYLRHGPATDNASTIIRDPGTTSITGLYTQPGERGRGVAAGLLNQTLAWSRQQGYKRCCVDFEPMNHLGARFWKRHFATVCVTMLRCIDSRIPRNGV